jgi:hypothetical protein
MPLADPGAVAGITEDKKRYPRTRSIGSGFFLPRDAGKGRQRREKKTPYNQALLRAKGRECEAPAAQRL